MASAIAAAADGGTVRFRTDCTIKFGPRTRITLRRPITIDAGSKTVILDGNQVSQIFAVTGAPVTLRGLVFRSGNADGSFGGAIANLGRLVIIGCVFSGNHADGDGAVGGAIDSDGLLDIMDSTFVGNHSDGGAGGAIAAYRGTMRVSNSTFVDNHADGGLAGAIWSIRGRVELVNTTIARNRVGPGQGGGIYNADDGTIILRNTIVADNVAASAPDVLGSIASARHSLIGSLDGTRLRTSPTDRVIVGAFAGVKPLADNGGTTPTAAIDATSAAFGMGDVTVCAANPPSGAGGRDQRVVSRANRCSIGAFEPSAGK